MRYIILFLLSQTILGNEVVQKTLDEFCFSCHNQNKKKGGFLLSDLNNLTDSNLAVWESALHAISSNEMPPEEEKQLPLQEKEIIQNYLNSKVQKYQDEKLKRISLNTMRRLTPQQYKNSLESLFNTKLSLKTEIPDFDLGEIDESHKMIMSSSHLIAIMKMADEALTKVFEPLIKPIGGKLLYKPGDFFSRKYQRIDGARGILSGGDWNIGGHIYPFHIRTWEVDTPGTYKIRVNARALNPIKPITMRIARRYNSLAPWSNGKSGSEEIQVFQVPKGNAFKDYVTLAYLQKGDRVTIQKMSGPLRGNSLYHHEIETEVLLIKEIQVDGPLAHEWPSKKMQSIFGQISGELNVNTASKMLKFFAEKAFRREVTNKELESILSFFKGRLNRSIDHQRFTRKAWRYKTKKMLNDFARSVKDNLAYPDNYNFKFENALYDTCLYILASPSFIYRMEESKLNGFAKASRLSYFFWNTMPDNHLRTLAKNNKLSSEKELLKAIDYCLENKNSEKFLKNFIHSWFGTDRVGEMVPDRRLYSGRFDLLKNDMQMQAVEVFKEMIRNDLPLKNLLKTDWTMLNQRLAKHYGIKGVSGDHFQKIQLPDSHLYRGSIIGQAGVLSVLSNGTDSLPINRGVWVLERILGQELLPPPANIPPIEPDIRGLTTIVEQIRKHREIKNCNMCHKKIDPYGILLENFDALGKWRTHYHHFNKSSKKIKKLIDSNALINGNRKSGPLDLIDHLYSKKNLFYSHFAERLMIYALGRKLFKTEKEKLQGIISKASLEETGVKSLIKLVILKSYLMR